MSTKQLTNKLKKNVITTMTSIICKSFGPESLMTLMCTATGKVLTTNDGMVILEALHLSHPLAKLIVKSLQKQYRFTSDGIKTFLLYLSQAMTELEKLNFVESPACFKNLGSSNDHSGNRMSIQFMKIERDVLPMIWNELYAVCYVKTEEMLTLRDIRSVLNTNLSSHLSRKDSELFENLVIETITKKLSDEKTTASKVHRNATFMIENFDFMHLKLSKHLVESSSTLSGFLLRKDFSLKLPSLDEHGTIKYITMLCSIEGNICQDPDEIVHVKDQDVASRAFVHRVTTAREYIAVLQEHGISLVISSEKVPDFVLSMCRDSGISVVCYVEEEDIQFLERITDKQAVTSPFDSVDVRQVGELSSCKRTVIGTQRFIHLQFPEIASSNIPNMIIIASPTEGMADQLTSVVYKAYKSIQMCFAFQRPYLPENDKRDVTDSVSKCSDTQNSIKTDIFTAIGGGGFFEIKAAELLRKLSNNFSDLDVGLGCKVLHNSLLQVPRTLHKHLSRNSSTEARDYLEKHQELVDLVQQECVGGMDRRGRVCNPVEAGILEPLTSKISVLASVVQLLQQVTRIDAIVSTGRRDTAPTNSDNEED